MTAGIASAQARLARVGPSYGACRRPSATATTNPFWQYPQYAQIETVIADRVQAVLVGQQSAKDAMAQAGDQAQKLLG